VDSFLPNRSASVGCLGLGLLGCGLSALFGESRGFKLCPDPGNLCETAAERVSIRP
jgi:hypothetical protein